MQLVGGKSGFKLRSCGLGAHSLTMHTASWGLQVHAVSKETATLQTTVILAKLSRSSLSDMCTIQSTLMLLRLFLYLRRKGRKEKWNN